jgi:hypothetical protein
MLSIPFRIPSVLRNISWSNATYSVINLGNTSCRVIAAALLEASPFLAIAPCEALTARLPRRRAAHYANATPKTSPH